MLLVALVFFVILTPVRVKSSGVCDFFSGDLVFADRLSKYVFGFERGDAAVISVAAARGTGSEKHIVRMIAFGGEKVTAAEGRLYIDDSLLDEAVYAELLPASLRTEFTVPEGSVLALPDERSSMTEEQLRQYVVSLGDVVGEARLIAYPLARIRFFG